MLLGAEQIKSRLRSTWKLYTLPQTLAEILKVTGSDDAGAGDLTRIVLRDPSLTTKLLKLANSATYGQARRVTTVNQAIVLLGFRAVKSLALSTSVYDTFSRRADFSEEQLKRFWRHSLETATYAQLFAARINYPVQEEAFVAGLIHDLGLLVMASIFPEQYGELLKRPMGEGGIVEVEERELGVSHAFAAACLFADWGLPEVLVEAVRHHHRVDQPGKAENRDQLTLLVGLADRMGRHPLEPLPAAPVNMVDEKYHLVERLGLSSADLKDVDSWVTANLSSIAGYLDIDIGSPIEILSEANDILFELYLELEGLLLNRRESLRREAADEKAKIASEVMQVVSATFSHYINNATTTIMGHAQLIEMALQNNQISDSGGRVAAAMKTIQNSVINITAVIDELKAIPAYNVVNYHERCKILDIDSQIRQRIDELLTKTRAGHRQASIS